jgi:hypothetical protein
VISVKIYIQLLFLVSTFMELKQEITAKTDQTFNKATNSQWLPMDSWSRDSSVGIATGYGLDDQGEWELESR